MRQKTETSLSHLQNYNLSAEITIHYTVLLVLLFWFNAYKKLNYLITNRTKYQTGFGSFITYWFLIYLVTC